MDKLEAQKILGEQLQQFRNRTHAELVPFVESQRQEHFKVRGTSGATYYVEIQFFWDDKHRGRIRVVGSIDDGRGFRAFVPLTETFLVSRPESVKI
jgi:hypothetical protein